MPIEFRCPQCGRVLQAGESTVGRRVLCPGCGAFAAVPPPEAATGESPPPPEPTVEQSMASSSSPPTMGNPFASPSSPEDSENPYLSPTQYGPPSGEGYYGPPTDARAVVAFVLGVTGFLLFCCCPLIPLPIGIIGVMLGAMAARSSQRGLAIAGVVLCSIQLLLGLAYVVLIVVGVWTGR